MTDQAPDQPIIHEGLPLQEEPIQLPETTPQEKTISEEPIIDPSIDQDCNYCQNKEKYQSLTDDFVKRSLAKTGDKISVPFVEDLALSLNKDEDELKLWLIDPKHPEFTASIKKLLLIQKARLLQKAAGRFQPEGAIYLLQKLHNL